MPEQVPNRAPIVQLQYAYDNASNRLSKLDKRPGALQQAKDFESVYDGLDRLVESKRGIAGTSFAQSSSTLNASQKWSLDMLGNWNSVYFDSNASGTYTSSSPDEEEVRTHDQANEIVSRVPDGASPPTLPFTYDAAGNLAEQARSSTTTAVLTHDCWNRLIKVQTRVSSTTSPLAEYEYNGLHWRTVKRTDTTVPVDGVLDEKREMYYSANWQLLEERIDTNYVSGSGVNAISQQFWGARYIDDAVAKRIDRIADGDFADSDDDAYFYLTDAQFSVVAVIDSGANLRERLSYDAYGHARHHWGADVDGDGDVDGSDAGTNNAQIDGSPSGYKVDADYNRDGVTNSSDVTDAKAFFGTSESAVSPYGLLCGPCTGLVGTTTVNQAGEGIERVYYSTYGVPECYSFGDANMDGTVDGTDLTITGYSIMRDLNLDGAITTGGDGAIKTNYDGYVGGQGELTCTTGTGVTRGNEIGYAGYLWNDERSQWHVRNRELSPRMGRWLQRDELEYIEGCSLYHYVSANPINEMDPMAFGSIAHPTSPGYLALCNMGSATQYEEIARLFAMGYKPAVIAMMLGIAVECVQGIIDTIPHNNPSSKPIPSSPPPSPRIPLRPPSVPPSPGTPVSPIDLPPYPVRPAPLVNPLAPCIPPSPGIPNVLPMPDGFPAPIVVPKSNPVPWRTDCPPCLVPPPLIHTTHSHWPCKDHIHWWWVSGQGPPPMCLCSLKKETSCLN